MYCFFHIIRQFISIQIIIIIITKIFLIKKIGKKTTLKKKKESQGNKKKQQLLSSAHLQNTDFIGNWETMLGIVREYISYIDIIRYLLFIRLIVIMFDGNQIWLIWLTFLPISILL
jgi:hypothetical protein